MKTENKVLYSLIGLTLVLLVVLAIQRTNQNEVVYRAIVSSPAVPGLTLAGPAPVTPVNMNSGNYPVIPGGVSSAKDFCARAETDPVLKNYIKGFNCTIAYETTLGSDITVFMTFRKNNGIFWSRRGILVHKGERMITDGTRSFLIRCANEIQFTPQTPTMDVDTAEVIPPVHYVDKPVASAVETPTYSGGGGSVYTPAPAAPPSAPVQESKKWWVIAAPVVLFHNQGHDAPPKPSCDIIEYGTAGCSYR